MNKLEKNLGFSRNPFSKKSSEQELDFLEFIFYQPNYYETLRDVLADGDSRFIIGQRGHGKSSIVNKLFDDLEEINVFTVKIDRFDSIPIKRNETALIKLIITSLITKTAAFLQKNPTSIKKLDKVKKEKLALFFQVFFEPLSRTEFDKICESVRKIKRKNLFISLFNYLGIDLANKTTSVLIEITATTIRTSLGLPDIESSEQSREYFKKIQQLKNDKIPLSDLGESKEKLKAILDEILNIISTLGFKGTSILFDKVDEYQSLNQEIKKITSFTSEILSDTELLLNDKFSIGFSLWSELKSELGGIVRFDKFGTIDVRWRSSDLTPLIDKRLGYFSIRKNKVKLSDLIHNELDREDLIKVSNKSPRDLISALSDIFQVQANDNHNTSNFEPKSITKGLTYFCSNYDYDSLTPSKTGKNKEIRAMINRILKVRLTAFSIKDLTSTFNQKTSQSEGQIKIMMDYKLIRQDEIHGISGERVYEVIEPKLVYLLKRGVVEIEQ